MKTTRIRTASNLDALLNGAGKKADKGTRMFTFPKKSILFSQGDATNAAFYIQAGKVKVTVVSEQGKEAVVAILERSAFLGESCLVGQTVRTATATTLEDSRIFRIEKAAMLQMFQKQPRFAEAFMSYLLLHSIRVQEDLVDQLFNSSEKRLARALLLLAHFGKESKPETVIAKISQETLAEMIGTIRLLNEALTAEIICTLRYKRHYFMTAGIRSRHVKAKFLQHVTDEQAHADQLVRQIIHLGSKPDLSPEWLLNWSHAERVEGDSVRKMVTADLLAERSAIDSYRAMIASTGADDPTTRVILEQILAQEEARCGEPGWSLKRCAPKRRGEVTDVHANSCEQAKRRRRTYGRQRCRGLLVCENFDDLGIETNSLYTATRCANCGCIEDAVFRANRFSSSERREVSHTGAEPSAQALIDNAGL